jgi:FkbM family methyltransferase
VDDLETGWEYQRAGRLSDAAACYRRFLGTHPDHAEGWAAPGVVAFKQQYLDQAINCYLRCLDLKPGSPDVLATLGVAYAVKGDLVAAELAFRQAIAVRPTFIAAYRHLGHALRDQGNFAAAVQAYQRARILGPDDVEILDNLKSVLQMANRAAEPIDPLVEAAMLAPQAAQLHQLLGISLPNTENKTLLQVGPVRLKQCRHGFMLYLVTDQYIGQSLDRYGEYSEGEAELFRMLVQPGWTILEIGANLGVHTVSLAKTTGPQGAVHAFEPHRVIFQLLCANVALNALSNVHTYQAAMGREAATTTVPKFNYGATRNFGGVSLGEFAKGERVPVMTVDSMNLSACHMIKVDVEGMESEVIAGAELTIRRFRPVIYLENDREEKSAALIRQLLEMDYRLYWHLPPLFEPENYFGASENIFGNTVSANMLGLHQSVSQQIPGLREVISPEERWQFVS